MRYLLNLLLFLISASAFAIPSPSAQYIPINHNEAAELKIILNAVVLKNTNWTISNIKEEIEKANNIFSQCNMQIGAVNLTFLGFPSSLSGVEYSAVENIARYLEREKIRKPKQLFVIFSELRREQKDSGGFAMPRMRFKDTILENLAVLSHVILTDAYKINGPEKYSPLAHELGHVLFNQLHVSEHNLMGEYYQLVNDQVTEEQCSKLKAFLKPVRPSGYSNLGR